MNELTQPNQLIANQYTITAAQFVEENYAGKIARGECKVYKVPPAPPAEDAHPMEKWAYQQLLTNGGLFVDIEWVEKDDDAYVAHTPVNENGGCGQLLMDGSTPLLVIRSERWVTIS